MNQTVSVQISVHYSESKGVGVKTPLTKLKFLAYVFSLIILLGLVTSCTNSGSEVEAVPGSVKMQERPNLTKMAWLQASLAAMDTLPITKLMVRIYP